MTVRRRLRRKRARRAPELAQLASEVFAIVNSDGAPRDAACVQWALAAVLAGAALGRTLFINAGSAEWHAAPGLWCGYVHEPDAWIEVLSLGPEGEPVHDRRPLEFHAWAVEATTTGAAVIDATSGYQRARFRAAGHGWTAPPLPSCIDLDGHECARRGWSYRADEDATTWAREMGMELLAVHDAQIRAWFRARREART